MTAEPAAGSVLLAAVCDFGWGSLGKLRLILDHLPKTAVALYGDASINEIATDLLRERRQFVPLSPQRASVALVINDPVAAGRIAAQDVPVIYVDSLPYLWSTPDEVPAADQVAIYCAQKFPVSRVPVASVLRERTDVQWIDPIVPPIAHRQGGGGVIVNVGGLHSHLLGDSGTAYLDLVVTPLLRELQALSLPVLAVCGNLPNEYRRQALELLPQCGIGPQSPYEFEALLRQADFLITSPGSTTILQALSLRLPTLLLPPQNLSQILNARLFCRDDAPPMSWPIGVIDPVRIDDLRPAGEDAVLAYIYGSIGAAAANETAALEVAVMVRKALRGMPKSGVLDPSLRCLGFNGAAQVAQRVRQALLAPLPRPSTGLGLRR
jgi:hydroxymethylcytosylglucuronate/cytosylglucuronate synthase